MFNRNLLALLLLPLLLTGCTTGRDKNQNTGGQVVARTGGDSGDAGTLRAPLVAEPTTLDPSKAQDIVTGEMVLQVFEGLTRIGTNNQVEPLLSDHWDISADGKTYTFHIRPGVKFHNGRGLEAADVKASWEHALSPQTASAVAANYIRGVVGVDEVVAGKRPDLAGVEVVNSETVRVHLDQPRSYFLSMLTYPTNAITCREAIAQTGGQITDKSMVGTGPFRLESYAPGDKAVFAANPEYWGGKPKLARLEMKVILDPETLYNNFQSGAIDAWVTSIPNSRYTQDRATGRFKDEWVSIPTASVDYLVMQPDKQPIFRDKRVRQAFAYAIDRDQILKTAYQSIGTRADGFLPPNLPNAGKQPPPIPYDPAKAKALLAQAGYPDGKGFPTLTLTVQDKQTTFLQASQIVQANLRDNLGITVQIQSLESGQYFDRDNRHDMEMYYAEWIADYPDAQDFLSTILVSTAPLDRPGYKNPQFDALCLQADRDTDPARRAELYSQANALMSSEVGVLPITFGPRLMLMQKNVKGWQANLCFLMPHTQTSK